MKLQKLIAPKLSWHNGSVPKSQHFDDHYYSIENGVQEAGYVFLKHNQLAKRLDQACSFLESSTFRIAETGFGTGLNLLLTLALWFEKTAKQGKNNRVLLHFVSFEMFPLRVADLEKAHQAYPDLAVFSTELRRHYPLLLPGWHDIWLFDKQVRVTLWFGDALAGLAECDATAGSQIDAWFLDGFTPAKNPEMWQPALFQQMARLSHKDTTFATFSAAGDVRRGLQKVGFAVHKTHGWGKKREMCFGQLAHVRPHSLKAPWFARPEPIATGTAIVIGAGLAGASVAYKLAEAGWQVTVLEANNQAAQHASGNLAGTIHPLITADWNLRSQWYLQGFEASLRQLLPWLANKDIQGNLAGLVQLAVTDVGEKRVKEALKRVGLPDCFAYWMAQDQCAFKAGSEVNAAGLYFPQAGWVSPPSIVKRCLMHKGISVQYGQVVDTFERIDNQWQIHTGERAFKADCLIVATGALNNRLNQQLGLPIRPVKGQVSHFSAQQQTSALNCAVMHEGYSVTLDSGLAVSGATFEAPDRSASLSIQSHQTNLDRAKTALPHWINAQANSLQGRVAFRPTTPDHLPIIGPVADPQWMQQAYLSQSHTHAVYRYANQHYQPGLFVSNGHGARGLMSVFLAAESIVADLQGQPLLQPNALYHASHPARFAIKPWRSGQKEVKG